MYREAPPIDGGDVLRGFLGKVVKCSRSATSGCAKGCAKRPDEKLRVKVAASREFRLMGPLRRDKRGCRAGAIELIAD